MANKVKVVAFHNFSDEIFSAVKTHKVHADGISYDVVDENCAWDGEKFHFEPGDTMYMPDWKAAHFAKHLVNRELTKAGMSADCSPKDPKENPRFMALFNKAFIDDPSKAPVSEDMSEAQAEMLNKDREIERLKRELEEAKNGSVSEILAPATEIHTVATEGHDDSVEVTVPKESSEGSELVTPIVDEDDEKGAFPDLQEGQNTPQA